MAGRDELDRLLDSALASYSDAEPLAGIEERVLRRVVASKRHPWLWWVAGAVPAAACLMVLLASRQTVAPPPLPTAPAAPVTVAKNRPEPAAVKTPRAPRPVRRPQVAKRNQFPVTAPLTGEEQRLLQLAAAAPEALQPALLAPLEIEPIQIKPLDISGSN